MQILTRLFITVGSFIAPLLARAQETTEGFLETVGAGAEVAESRPLPELVGSIINVFLSIIGAVLVALLVYGGYLWMIARGDTENVKKAKETITNAIIGLVVILIAYSVARFVVTRLIAATTGG